MDYRLTNEYKEKETKEARPRLRRATGLSKKAKEAALKNFEKKDVLKQKDSVPHDNLKHP
tara:strand:+ start:4672 stop:4851 length:180 start_codon:yes stop_codon:yes gene_type:complete